MSTAFATTVKWTAGAIAVWGASSILYKYFMAKPKVRDDVAYQLYGFAWLVKLCLVVRF